MPFAPALDSWWWRVVMEKILYRHPMPPPRQRTKPMEVICVGFPRSGTESLQQALQILGYDAFHTWDISFGESRHRMPGWLRLCRKKFYANSPRGDVEITASDFDELMGDAAAVTDLPASLFAAELIQAYPDAKVILNMRSDLDAWLNSYESTLLNIWDSYVMYVASFFGSDLFWAFHLYMRFMLPLQMRAPDGDLGRAARRNGKWVYRDHCNMVRGLVPKDRLLEWNIGDGWSPICTFLSKKIPNEDFPHANAVGQGWKEREKQITQIWVLKALRNLAIVLGLTVAAGAYAYRRS